MTQWIRVSKRLPCPVCGRPDWCLVADDGSAAICPRTESPKQCGEAGYLHNLTSDSARPPRYSPCRLPLEQAPRARVEEIAALASRFQATAQKCGAIPRLSGELGLTAEALIRFGVGWSLRNSFWSLPMYDHRGWILGINRRFTGGEKKIMPGHRAGLYLPGDLPDDCSHIAGPLIVTEGATDAMAALDLGFWAVGRFSCTHGAKLVVKLVSRIKPARLVLVGDNDGPGRRGVECLACALLPYVRELRVIYPLPPHKDLRAWKQAGATFEDLTKVVEAAPVRRLGVEVRHG